MKENRGYGPLTDGCSVGIIGGGPAGVSCGLRLLKEASKLNKKIEVYIFEPKEYGTQYNQCMGVLSPPILNILENELEIKLPESMLQRKILGYVLYSEKHHIDLVDQKSNEISWAIRRVELDKFLLKIAEERGCRVIKVRATNVEFHPEDAIIYTDGATYSVDVIVGAFGLDATLRNSFCEKTNYKPPQYLDAIVSKIHPPNFEYIDAFKGRIQVFIPSNKRIEFAAITPKGNHFSVIVAGKTVGIKDLKAFLSMKEVKELLPFHFELNNAYAGCFPTSPATSFYGNRFVIIGDAAGLMRPFKGKGINSAILTGIYAADVIIYKGISKEAFYEFEKNCKFLIKDLWYGRFVRYFTYFASKYLSLDPLIRYAEKNLEFRQALFEAVSGQNTYKNIVLTSLKPRISLGLFLEFCLNI